ncbi:MAG: tyrosine-type recombinase/integrase, partial [Miltoncostaeaceae bacterium]
MANTVESPPVQASEALSLLETSSDRTSTGRRNRALIALLWRAGLRPGEALSLPASDINVDGRRATVADRTVGLDDMAAREAAAWQERRVELGLPNGGPFISTLRGKPLSQAYVRELLPRLAERAGLEHRVHAMGLRYACAAEIAREGVPTEIIEAQLGVRPQSPVARYLPTPDDSDVIVAMA